MRAQILAVALRQEALFDSEDKCPYTLTVEVEWDPEKAAANLRLHGVRFAEAITVLGDPFAITREDPDAIEEQRFVTLGMSDEANLLAVVYAYREPDSIRIISAWKAGRQQRMQYEEGSS